MKTLCVALALIGAVVHPAAAEDEIAFFTPGDPVLDHPAITYADLIKQVIPDFGLNADADWVGTLPDGIGTSTGRIRSARNRRSSRSAMSTFASSRPTGTRTSGSWPI